MIQGRYKIRTSTGRDTGWIKNLVVTGPNSGIGLITQNLVAGATNSPVIDRAKIGTGTTPAAAGNTDLQTPVLSDILPTTGLTVVTPSSISLEFFIPDIDLANGTYTEFGLFCGTRLFARSIISPSFTKETGEDVIITYEITITP
ncbi:hypothetical protein ACRDNQ_04035 [Palleronia sp. KMU-117]|uniref:hypothetical protein n=1 Tax=Palleronia sp. KMU-117 TaxID=3434108 RepID=UPI003D74086E